MSDDFNTSAQSSNGYDPYKVYRSTTNTKGFSSRMRIALPPEALALAAEIAARRCIDGIKTPADMMRDAFIHRLHTYEEMLKTTDPILANRVAEVRHRMDIETTIEMSLQSRQADRELAEKAMKLLQEGGDAARPLVQSALSIIRTADPHDRLARVINYEV